MMNKFVFFWASVQAKNDPQTLALASVDIH
jgi:hypothetical protein